MKTAVFVLLVCVYTATGDVTRGSNSRSAFIELPRFENCGMNIDYSPYKTDTAGSYATCTLRCLSDSTCKSSDFDMWNNTCNLYSVTVLDKLEEKFGYMYADLEDSNPNVGIIHPCESDPCNPGQLCEEKCAPNGYACECPEGMTGSNCNEVAAVNGEYTSWYDIDTECSSTCIITAYRNCTDPAPLAGGKDCEGSNTRYEHCDADDCAVYPYLGCYHPTVVGVDIGPIVDLSNSIDSCSLYCSSNGYRIAALKKRNCYCKKNWEADFSSIVSSKCGASCPGDNSQTCGGSTYMSVYSTGGPYQGCFTGSISNGLEVDNNVEWIPTTLNPTTLQTTTLTTVVTTAKTTVAPTQDTGNGTSNTSHTEAAPTTANPTTVMTTVMDPSTINPTTTLPLMTVSDCRYACALRAFMYASLSEGYLCTCHNELSGMTIDKSEGNCDIDCTGGGDSGVAVCGGVGAYSIYDADVYGISDWTDWFDTDDPDDGDGWDRELISTHQSSFSWICSEPTDIECQTKDRVPYDVRNQTLHDACTLDDGLSCSNEELGIWVNVTYNVTSYEIVNVVTSENETDLVCNLVPVTAAPPEDNNGTTVQTTTAATSDNVTESSVTPTPLMALKCTNVTNEIVVTTPVNTSYIEGHLKTINIPGSCDDYEVRYLCEREDGAHLGCYEDTEAVSLSSSSLPSLTVSNCKMHCSSGGYRLAAIKSVAGTCSCANSLSSIPIDYQQCGISCSDGLPCGGTNHKSIYLTECDGNFGVQKSAMEGTKLHNNDGSDEYGTWYDSFYGNDVTLNMYNYSNADAQMDLVLKISLTDERTVNAIETKGMYVFGEEIDAGVNSFYLGYQHDGNDEEKFYQEYGTEQAYVFTMSDLSGTTTHQLSHSISAKFLYIHVLTYDYYPGIKLDFIGCASS